MVQENNSHQGIFTQYGRCHPYWEEVVKCYDSSIFPSRDCLQQLEDYQECLHRKKELQRKRRIALEAKKQNMTEQ
jgi:NADH dehydrogenase (ubiquinone) Fe-S protein 5